MVLPMSSGHMARAELKAVSEYHECTARLQGDCEERIRQFLIKYGIEDLWEMEGVAVEGRRVVVVFQLPTAPDPH